MIEICSENNHPDTNRFKQNFEDFLQTISNFVV